MTNPHTGTLLPQWKGFNSKTHGLHIQCEIGSEANAVTKPFTATLVINTFDFPQPLHLWRPVQPGDCSRCSYEAVAIIQAITVTAAIAATPVLTPVRNTPRPPSLYTYESHYVHCRDLGSYSLTTAIAALKTGLAIAAIRAVTAILQLRGLSSHHCNRSHTQTTKPLCSLKPPKPAQRRYCH